MKNQHPKDNNNLNWELQNDGTCKKVWSYFL